MTGKKALVKLYYDIVSPFAWVGFESLLRYESILDIQLELLPVSIGFIFKETNNKPNITQSPQKALNMSKDLALLGNYWGIPFKSPKDFNESLVRKATLNPQRFLTALSIHRKEFLRPASREFWLRAWSKDEPVYGIEDIKQICEKLQIPQSQQLIESCNSAEVKALLKERTEEALATGAFGLPWIVLKREGQKDLSIWGGDRLPMICDLLGKPFVGPLREQSQIEMGRSKI